MKTHNIVRRLRGCAILVTAALAAAVGANQEALAATLYGGGTYTENFDTLTTVTSTSASADTLPWTNDVTLAGWSLFRQAAPGTAITAYKGGDGSVNTGSFYSFGTTGVAERALGGVASGGAYFGSPASGAVAGWIAVGLTNNTGAAFSEFTVSYDGEQWRDGGFSPSGSLAQTMVLEYGFGNTFQTVASWNAPGAAYNFTSPTIGNTAGVALDGNLPANRTAGIGGTISNITWTPGSTLWVRWAEVNDIGNDHALSVDNFQLTTVPEPATWVMAAIGTLGVATVARRRRTQA